MRVEESAGVTEADEGPPGPSGAISALSALRLLLVLMAVWSGFSGLALVFFQEGAGATIGGGLEGGEGEAAQRLLGVHLLVLAPLYALLAWDPRRYRMLLWLPYVAQGGVVVVTFFDIISGDRAFQDAALPLIVAATFLVLLLYVWRAGRAPQAPPPAVAETPAVGATPGSPTPGELPPPDEPI
jgi:hypothetical protein